MIARLVYHGEVAIVTTPYSRAFVDEIKVLIPHEYREWVADRKVWHVRYPYDRHAATLLAKHFPYAEIEERWDAKNPHGYQHQSQWQPLNPPSRCSCSPDHQALYVCGEAPVEVIKAAYKALAKQIHPDNGGDVVLMQQLNEVYERVLEGASS